MNEFQVTFLDRPEVGKTARIIYNGQAGQTARITSVQQHPNQPDYFRVITEQNIICIGAFNPQAQATTPVQTQVMNIPPPNAMPQRTSAKSNFPKWLSVPIGCFGLLIVLGIIGTLVGDTSSAPATAPNTTETTPRIGDIVFLRSDNGDDIVVANSKQSLNEFTDAAAAKDYEGAQKMLFDGRLYWVHSGTQVRMLADSGIGCRSVRILDGDHYGQVGWIASEWIKRK